MSWLQDLAWPWLLLALPLPWLLRRLLPPVATGAALRVPWADRLDTGGGATAVRRGARGGLRLWLAAVAWACLCVAAARPQALGEAVQPPQAGRDLMLAVDLSGSMAEEDMLLGNRVVDRLTAALQTLVDHHHGLRQRLQRNASGLWALEIEAPGSLDAAEIRNRRRHCGGYRRCLECGEQHSYQNCGGDPPPLPSGLHQVSFHAPAGAAREADGRDEHGQLPASGWNVARTRCPTSHRSADSGSGAGGRPTLWCARITRDQ